jgi:hypothetical protein
MVRSGTIAVRKNGVASLAYGGASRTMQARERAAGQRPQSFETRFFEALLRMRGHE